MAQHNFHNNILKKYIFHKILDDPTRTKRVI